MLWRVLLAVTSLFGVGVLLYVVGWLLIPDEGDTGSPLEALLGRGRSSNSPVLAIVLGAIAVLVFSSMIGHNFRGAFLVIALVVGGVVLLNRNSARRRAEAATGNPPPYAPQAAAYTPPPAAADAPAATPFGGFAPPSAPPGFRPPFAPRGPFARGPVAPPPIFAPRPPKPPRERSQLGILTLSLVLLALGATATLDLANVVPVHVGGYFAAMLTMVGLGLLIGAWFGRARWLIPIGLVFALGLGIAGAAERIDTSNFASDRTWRPASFAELNDHYKQDFGNATLDLRQVDFTGQDADVAIRVNAGRVQVLLPPEVDTTVSAKLNAGNVDILGTHWDGFNSTPHEMTDLGADGAGGGKLRLDIRINAGNVEVDR